MPAPRIKAPNAAKSRPRTKGVETVDQKSSLLASAAVAATAFVACAGAAAPAKAADETTASSQVAEVIVTVEKREQKLQDVPAAISAFNQQMISAASVVNLTDLSGKIPNVTLDAVATFPNASSFSI